MDELPAVCHAVQSNTKAYLITQGLSHVNVVLSDEPPQRDPRSGKFRQVWAELRSDAPGSALETALSVEGSKELA